MGPKRIKYSIGRNYRIRHSTSMDWDEWEKKRRKYPVVYSTGEDSRISHSTGKELDRRVKLKLLEKEMKKSKQKIKKKRDKKSPPDTFRKVTIDY